jgi:hypothetical protein
MADVRASAYVTEDVALDEHVMVRESGEPVGWLYLGGHGNLALWGSPGALRRVAAALVLVAERAEGLRVLRYAVTGNDDRPRGASELPGCVGRDGDR